MRTGNTIDGMYFFFLLIPFLLSLWGGDILRKRTVSNLMIQSNCNHYLSAFAGIFVEIVIIIIGVITGIVLIALF